MNTRVSPKIQNTIRQVQNLIVGNRNVQVETPEQWPGDIGNEHISGPSLFQEDALQDVFLDNFLSSNTFAKNVLASLVSCHDCR